MTEPVRAEVKNILVFGDGQADYRGIDGFTPPDPEHFGASVQVFIGSVGSDHSDSFDLVVCTPSWAAAELSQHWDRWRFGPRSIPDTVHPGAGFWFMRRWNRANFEEAVGVLCETCSPGPDWGSVASRIGRVIPWEFDYKYDAHVDEASGQPFPPPR